MTIVIYFSPTLRSLLCFNESIEISRERRGSLMVEVKSSAVKSIFWNVMSDDGPVPCSVERFYRFVYFFLDGVLRMESHFVGLVLILQFRIQVGFVRCTGIHWQFCRWSHLFYPLLSCLFQHEARSCWISFGWLVMLSITSSAVAPAKELNITRFCLFAIFQPSTFPMMESPSITVAVLSSRISEVIIFLVLVGAFYSWSYLAGVF